ncbi:MAG: hypothetical protein IJO04_03705 [Oscillospiraceae bacterium]|nr:hypothetical protein [Oscillospiraceae bacterium]
MKSQGKVILFKLIAIILIVALVVPYSAMAASVEEIQPYASKYLSAYNTYICHTGSGQYQIWYEVIGTNDMDEIGVLSIELYEVNSDNSLTWITTYLYEDHDTMLVYDDWYHCSYVSFQGSSTKTYKAYVCIWAGKNGGGDTRYMWATLV